MAALSPLFASLLHGSRSRQAWRVVLLSLIAVTGWFAFGPAPPLPELQDGDKLHHLLAFLALGAAASFSQAPGRLGAARAAAGLLLYGAFIEVVQTQLPHRHGDWADLGADALGAACGLLLATALRRSTAVAAPKSGAHDGHD